MTGIITQYKRYEPTFAAISLARYFDSIGRKYMFIRYDDNKGSIDPFYDNLVTRQTSKDQFNRIKEMIWTATVDEYFIYDLRKKGTKSYLYTSCDQLEPFDEAVIGTYSQVLMPSQSQANLLKTKLKIKNVGVLPFYCHLPITKKTSNVQIDRVKIFLSLYGSHKQNIDAINLKLLVDLIEKNPFVIVTIVYSGNLSPLTYNLLKQYAKRYPISFCVKKINYLYESINESVKHDLVICPAKVSGFGINELSALSNGTPVLAWNIQPASEYLNDGRNSILVACDKEYNWLGVQKAKADYEEFYRVLGWLVNHADSLTELRKHTSENLEDRQNNFYTGLNNLLSIAY